MRYVTAPNIDYAIASNGMNAFAICMCVSFRHLGPSSLTPSSSSPFIKLIENTLVCLAPLQKAIM